MDTEYISGDIVFLHKHFHEEINQKRIVDCRIAKYSNFYYVKNEKGTKYVHAHEIILVARKIT